MSLKREIEFVLNGVQTRATVPVDMSALAMLREVVGLTGTKYALRRGRVRRLHDHRRRRVDHARA